MTTRTWFGLLLAASMMACSVSAQDLGNNDDGGQGDAAGSETGDNTDAGPHGTLGPPDAKRMFVTSTPYLGDIVSEGSGKAFAPEWSRAANGADNLCNTAAQAASLGGTWKAWISDSTAFGVGGPISAIDRINDVAGGWYNVDRTAHPFANKAALATGPNPAEWSTKPDQFGETVSFIKDENGAIPGFQEDWFVWTGTASGGHMGTSDCSGFTTSQFEISNAPVGVAGSTTRGASNWTDYDEEMCSMTARLYCFEQ